MGWRIRSDRRTFIRATAALWAGTTLPLATQGAALAGGDWHALAEDVKAEMAWACDNYRELAWGKDEIKPVSGTYSSFPLKGHHLGLNLIEALDTLWLMGLDDRFVDVDFETGKIVSSEQDELASFYGGLLAQGGERELGADYTQSRMKVQDRCGILPEAYDYAAALPTQKGNALRPELADSAFTIWLLDRNPRWRELGRAHFRSDEALEQGRARLHRPGRRHRRSQGRGRSLPG